MPQQRQAVLIHRPLVAATVIAVVAALLLNDFAFANGSVRETEYSTSLTEATGIVRIVVAVFGGLIGILGIFVAIRGVAPAADVTGSVTGVGKLSMKRVSQGVVITLIGAAVLVGALYFLPEKRSERELAGKSITIERDEGRTTEVLKK